MSPSSPIPSAQASSPDKKLSKKRKRVTTGDIAAEASTSKTFKAAEAGQSGGFLWRRFKLDIPLAPCHSGDLREGIEQVLDRWLSRYVPSLGFVLLSVDPNSLICPTSARILPPGAMALAQGVTFNALGWRPTIGSQLRGRIMHSTRSNISLIIHNTFNAVIEHAQLPDQLYQWDADKVNPVPPYEPLEDDFYKDMFQEEMKEEQEAAEAAAAAQVEGATEGLEDLALQTEQAKQEEGEEPENVVGCWVHRATQEPVGDDQGMLDFTVTGLTVANSTVTVVGSLKKQPFATPASPETQPQQQQQQPAFHSEIDLDQLPVEKSKTDKKKRKKQKE